MSFGCEKSGTYGTNYGRNNPIVEDGDNIVTAQ